MTSVGTSRPRRRWHHATTILDDFVVVSFRVDPERLRRRVPSQFEPRRFTFADGREAALVSVVAFVERNFAFRFAPFVRVSGALVDYRAYGSVNGEDGVYVFRTSLDHPFVVVPRVLWRMPWRRESVRIDGRWGGPGPASIRIAADGADGLAIDLTSVGDEPAALDGFVDAAESVTVLTHPMAGWYGRADDLRRYSVWHDVLRPHRASVDRSRVPMWEELDLVAGGAPAHSALMVRSAAFDVHTPPRRVR